MQRYVTSDGRTFLIPGDAIRVRDDPADEGVFCDCHRQMGNDFYFLPTGSCLRKDKTCNKV